MLSLSRFIIKLIISVNQKLLMTENNQDSRSVDVFGVGNALVDILALVEDEFVLGHGLSRGGMTLMNSETQGGILHDLEPFAANAIGGFGGKYDDWFGSERR